MCLMFGAGAEKKQEGGGGWGRGGVSKKVMQALQPFFT